MTNVDGVETSRKYRLECVRCDWRGPSSLLFRCPVCAGAIETRTDLGSAEIGKGDQPEEAYADLLPIESMDHLVQGISRVTPCRPAPELGRVVGVPRLWVKDESQQPTGSTKDRLAAVVLAVLRQYGVKEFVTSSTGNTAVALARAVRRDGAIQAHFFCGRDFAGRHDVRTDEHVTVTVVDGSFADATEAARSHADRHGLFWEGGFFNWARREGLKLAYLEAFDAMEAEPDVVVQAISSGMGIMAAHKGAVEYRHLGRLARIPRFLMVQQDTCAPMARAWRENRAELTDEDVIAHPDGLARAILLGDGRASYPYMRDIAAASGGAIVDVTQEELVEARRLLSDLEGLDVCHASAATVAAVRNEAAAHRIGPDEVVLVNLTGRQRPA
ncbi:pyridoxal-phosphate dependent enzyme [Streptomyces sp. NPDC006872]|uniref:threonine synthase n=1 Tax=Streptomyces sp. NPDC006872 TaxID=3155720 RepID=UPI0033CB416B